MFQQFGPELWVCPCVRLDNCAFVRARQRRAQVSLRISIGAKGI